MDSSDDNAISDIELTEADLNDASLLGELDEIITLSSSGDDDDGQSSTNKATSTNNDLGIQEVNTTDNSIDTTNNALDTDDDEFKDFLSKSTDVMTMATATLQDVHISNEEVEQNVSSSKGESFMSLPSMDINDHHQMDSRKNSTKTDTKDTRDGMTVQNTIASQDTNVTQNTKVVQNKKVSEIVDSYNANSSHSNTSSTKPLSNTSTKPSNKPLSNASNKPFNISSVTSFYNPVANDSSVSVASSSSTNSSVSSITSKKQLSADDEDVQLLRTQLQEQADCAYGMALLHMKNNDRPMAILYSRMRKAFLADLEEANLADLRLATQRVRIVGRRLVSCSDVPSNQIRIVIKTVRNLSKLSNFMPKHSIYCSWSWSDSSSSTASVSTASSKSTATSTSLSSSTATASHSQLNGTLLKGCKVSKRPSHSSNDYSFDLLNDPFIINLPLNRQSLAATKKMAQRNALQIQLFQKQGIIF